MKGLCGFMLDGRDGIKAAFSSLNRGAHAVRPYVGITLPDRPGRRGAQRAPFLRQLLGASLAVAVAPLAGAEPASIPAQSTRTAVFGEATVIETAVLRSTGILLHQDERLRSLSLPDSERWQIDFSEFGPEGATVPVVTVTPSACGLSTNLLILTTRRVYPLLLRSAPCKLKAGEDLSLPFDALVRFRYPDDERLKEIPQPPPPEPEIVSFQAPLEKLVENASRFRWEAKKGYRGPLPRLVTEDEQSTYLVFPKGTWRTQDLPLFFLLNDQGERELVNFDVHGETFQIRARFRQAVLVASESRGRKQPYLLLTRTP